MDKEICITRGRPYLVMARLCHTGFEQEIHRTKESKKKSGGWRPVIVGNIYLLDLQVI